MSMKVIKQAPAKRQAVALSRALCITPRCSLSFFSRYGRKPYDKYKLRTVSELTAGGDMPTSNSMQQPAPGHTVYKGVHHVALLCENLERSLEFYTQILGLEINPDRPHNKLPYRGAWLWISGPEMIHLMELPNPDPAEGRPEHGGRDRHFCVGVEDIEPLVAKLEAAKVPYTRSMSGRPAIFFRDPDMNCLEIVEMESWR
jgi:glyoxylase I family protein